MGLSLLDANLLAHHASLPLASLGVTAPLPGVWLQGTLGTWFTLGLGTWTRIPTKQKGSEQQAEKGFANAISQNLGIWAPKNPPGLWQGSSWASPGLPLGGAGGQEPTSPPEPDPEEAQDHCTVFSS